MPEAEQGLNVGRLISLMGLKVEDVPGVTFNRYCASGLENHWYGYSQNSIRMALYCAGGAESMSLFRWEVTNQLRLCCCKNRKRRLLLGNGIDNEAVAQQFKVSERSR
jgi:acetyl-CoA acyltransferase